MTAAHLPVPLPSQYVPSTHSECRVQAPVSASKSAVQLPLAAQCRVSMQSASSSQRCVPVPSGRHMWNEVVSEPIVAGAQDVPSGHWKSLVQVKSAEQSDTHTRSSG
jgi:hypothetical protein